MRRLSASLVSTSPDAFRVDTALGLPSFSVGQPLCKAAVDLACYDLWGKQSDRSVSELLGGARQKQVKLSWTVNSPVLALPCASTRSDTVPPPPSAPLFWPG